jgi:hypothetical protein
MRAFGAFMLEYAIEGIQPLVRFLRIVVRERCHEF